MSVDICTELHQNFIDFAYEANSARAFPDARDGLKPGQRACLWEMYIKGYNSNKPHVKSAKIDGGVAATWWPHGTTAIYETFARMSQPWINPIPEVDWHGSNGNMVIGSAPAADRYTEARLASAIEDGMLQGIKKNPVPMILNFSEDEEWPEVLPAIFPRLVVNGSQGIGVTIAQTWLCNNLKEITEAIISYAKTGTIDYAKLAPDFPTGATIINKDDLSSIYTTGKGKAIVRAKAEIKNKSIFITEFPYQVYIESLLDEIKELVEKNELSGIIDIYNKSDKNKLLVEIECSGVPELVLQQLYAKTSLQKSYNANQYALVGKTPQLLTLPQYIDIYLKHNIDCLINENKYDKEKAEHKLEIIEGLLKALENIDNIITLIKQSETGVQAQINLQKIYGFTEVQAKAIIDMKLGRLAHLEYIELNTEKNNLIETINNCNAILFNKEKQKDTVLERLAAFTQKYATPRKTKVIQLQEEKKSSKVEKDPIVTEPAKCVIVTMANDTIKRIPADSYKTQKRNTKGVKNQEDRTIEVLRTNTADSLLVFTNFGKVFRIPVIEIPESTNAGRGTPIGALIEMERGERASVVYGMAADTPAKYITFVTKNGLIKRTSLEDFGKIRKKTPTNAITLREGDNIAAAFLANDEDVIILTEAGWGIRFSLGGITPTGKTSQGVKGINVGEGDKVVTALPIRDINDSLAIFYTDGSGYKITLDLVNSQNRGGRGVSYITKGSKLAAAALVEDADTVLIAGTATSLCISAKDIPLMLTRGSRGSVLINGSGILSASKI